MTQFIEVNYLSNRTLVFVRKKQRKEAVESYSEVNREEMITNFLDNIPGLSYEKKQDIADKVKATIETRGGNGFLLVLETVEELDKLMGEIG